MESGIQLGYCCINVTLRKTCNVCVNHTCRKATFENKGLSYVSELAVKNLKNLYKILRWNADTGFNVYRMSSDMFPWASEYKLSDLPDYEEICSLLKDAGNIARETNQRLSFHPGPFNVLGSPNPDLVSKTINEINHHAEVMDLMNLPRSYHYPINIHCNGVYGDKKATLKRWCANYFLLSMSARNRLVIENDDKASMYSVKDLYDNVFSSIGVPITFDYHHHRFNSGGLTEEEAFRLAAQTWQHHNVKPLFHYSSCRKTYEDPECKAQAHADYVYEKIRTYNNIAVDIDVEAKGKEIAVLRYHKLNEDRKLLENYVPFDESVTTI